ncbi:hypothetical protein Cfor_01001, partial [Coptotermes formosanus]
MQKAVKSGTTAETSLSWELRFGLLCRSFHLKTEFRKSKERMKLNCKRNTLQKQNARKRNQMSEKRLKGRRKCKRMLTPDNLRCLNTCVSSLTGNNTTRTRIMRQKVSKKGRMMFLIVALVVFLLQPFSSNTERSDTSCDFESSCSWHWRPGIPHGFRLVTGKEAGHPPVDARNNSLGHFLLLSTEGHGEVHIRSPMFTGTQQPQCALEVWLFMSNMSRSTVRLVSDSNPQVIMKEIRGNSYERWEKYRYKIGPIRRNFSVILEVVTDEAAPAVMALDNLRLVDCFNDAPPSKSNAAYMFWCSNNVSINRQYVCDLRKDCPEGEDEEQDCDKLPSYSHCTFEDDLCGWTEKKMTWLRQNGSHASGPNVDHTYHNASGVYLYVKMSATDMGSGPILESPIFHPPPCYHSGNNQLYSNSCTIRFHYFAYGVHSAGLELNVVEMQPHQNKTTTLFWFFGGRGQEWIRSVNTLPNITHRYFLQFHAKKSYKPGFMAVDDLSMSPECFGFGVPANVSDGYVYNKTFCYQVDEEIHQDFVNKTVFSITTCGAKGQEGPTTENCFKEYKYSATNVTVLDTAPWAGMQRWTVPEGGYYTIIAKGASGGLGPNGGSSSGAIVRTVVELHRGQHLYVLVGQEGSSACKDLSSGTCARSKPSPSTGSSFIRIRTLSQEKSSLNRVVPLNFTHRGGGGGGGTFVFLVNQDNESVPLVVASGGGGLSHSRSKDDGCQHGHGLNASRLDMTGKEFVELVAGAGGGWRNNSAMEVQMETGRALLDSGIGGTACYKEPTGAGAGGFGGGGGGCAAGGGGGGFAGGNAWSEPTRNGEGGYSYVRTEILSDIKTDQHHGPGMVLIIPGLDKACNCDYRCVALDEFRSDVQCICPDNWMLAADNTSCILPPEPPITYIVGLMGTAAVLVLGLAFLCCCLYNRYQCKNTATVRQRRIRGTELPLNRLTEPSDSMVTESNPTYEFGGWTYTIRDLKDIPREQLRLVKALGQGAFGEVYQGFFRNRVGDAVEMPVAVKTLPELSTQQAESDFLMEALIMSKFNHPNVVHFIGVCFEEHPRFIVLELLAGGDLKKFLRESRPKPKQPSPLTMKDLLMCAMDVAKGCRYLEQHHFIHRDIAARNCLLTTKGPGRVVKIADFGMARDIYRGDYYRKGGTTMLPIKWMPPEAFLDGIFTSKTDVWSYGILLWEVMSLGYIPYPGCANTEVMELVRRGGRLECPGHCPGPVYGIMTQCWHPNPDERPGFSTILERLGYCMQDPDVINARLPVFHRSPSAERDATTKRPAAKDSSCLKVQQATEYLVPLLGSGARELPSSPSTSSVAKLLPANSTSDQETVSVLPESKSTQPLLEEASSNSSGSTDGLATVGTVGSLNKGPPNSNNNNNNNNNNHPKHNKLKVSLSLDPAALAHQPIPYLNVNMTPSHIMKNEVESQGHPFTVQAAGSRNLLSE